MSDMSKAMGGLGSGAGLIGMATQPMRFLREAGDNDIVKTATRPGAFLNLAQNKGRDLFSGRVSSGILNV